MKAWPAWRLGDIFGLYMWYMVGVAVLATVTSRACCLSGSQPRPPPAHLPNYDVPHTGQYLQQCCINPQAVLPFINVSRAADGNHHRSHRMGSVSGKCLQVPRVASPVKCVPGCCGRVRRGHSLTFPLFLCSMSGTLRWRGDAACRPEPAQTSSDPPTALPPLMPPPCSAGRRTTARSVPPGSRQTRRGGDQSWSSPTISNRCRRYPGNMETKNLTTAAEWKVTKCWSVYPCRVSR